MITAPHMARVPRGHYAACFRTFVCLLKNEVLYSEIEEAISVGDRNKEHALTDVTFSFAIHKIPKHRAASASKCQALPPLNWGRLAFKRERQKWATECCAFGRPHAVTSGAILLWSTKGSHVTAVLNSLDLCSYKNSHVSFLILFFLTTVMFVED